MSPLLCPRAYLHCLPNQPVFEPPARPEADIYFYETFSSEEDYEKKWVTLAWASMITNKQVKCIWGRVCFSCRWVESEATKDGVDADIAKYDGVWAIESPTSGGFSEDLGLVMKVNAPFILFSSCIVNKF